MTTNEYLARLKSCLECIDASEREAAVQFYTEYLKMPARKTPKR